MHSLLLNQFPEIKRITVCLVLHFDAVLDLRQEVHDGAGHEDAHLATAPRHQGGGGEQGMDKNII